MEYRVQLFSLIFLILLISVFGSLKLSSAQPSGSLMYPEDHSDSSVQFVEDDNNQSFVPQHESAEDYSVTSIKFTKPLTVTQIYYATPGTQIEVGIEIEVQHTVSSFNLNVRVELCSIGDSDSNKSESHGTIGRAIYTEKPYRAIAGPFTLSNDSDAREHFVKISVRLPDDSWAIIYDENDSSFPDGRLSTNSMGVDTDEDGLNDSYEVELGTDPTDTDTDDDRLNDSYEVELGTDPLHGDTDRDGLSDHDEVLYFGSDPLHGDTDRDGLSDSDEINIYISDPTDTDTDDDRLNDSYEVELGTNPADRDTDGDGLSDSYELDLGTNPRNSDTDVDGLSDGEEVNLGTNPRKSDTDGDGLKDGIELALGRDPRVADGDTISYSSLTLFIGIFAVAFFIVTITRRGTKQ